MTTKLSFFRSALSALVLGSLASGGCMVDEMGAGTDVEDGDRADQAAVNGTAFVHLFEWKWLDIARECEEFLGPKGFEAVQVSPPQEHIQGSQWWTRYQPVSYRLESRSGTRAEFIEMVERCDAAGVAIYVDAIINHMAAGSGGTGSGGSQYSNRSYPAVPYGPNDFHAPCSINNYNDANQVQNCSLVGLPDLNTGSAYVQDKIAAYLRELTDIGVAGFRIDAAKHMSAGDIKGILQKAGNPYVYQEVIGAYGEAVQPSWYLENGTVTEFAYSREIGGHFLNGQIKNARYLGDNKLPSDKAVVFTDNHDNQRGHGAGYQPVTYKNGSKYNIANAFMLAWPYGYPQVMSSYQFSDGDQGPPAGASRCDQPGWVCEHRWTTIANMVGFRNVTNGAPVANWWDNGSNQIAFSRGNKGFIAINNESFELSQTLQTGMPEGTYCNIASGDLVNGACTGSTVTVDSRGMASIRVAPVMALAIHAGAKLGAGGGTGGGGTTTPPPPATGLVDVTFTCENGTTYLGQSVYAVGNIAELGNWSAAAAVKLDATSYPTWKKTIKLPASKTVEWKCIKREESNANSGLVWQSGGNNTVTTPASGSVSTTGRF